MRPKHCSQISKRGPLRDSLIWLNAAWCAGDDMDLPGDLSRTKAVLEWFKVPGLVAECRFWR